MLYIILGELFYFGGGGLNRSTFIANNNTPLYKLNIPRRGFYLWLLNQRELLQRKAATAYTTHEGALEFPGEISTRKKY